MKRRVVVTGMGAITPLGNSAAELWKNCVAGISGITAYTCVTAVDELTVPAGLVRGEKPLLDLILSEKEQQRTDRFIHLGLIAAREALDQAGIGFLSEAIKDRCGVAVGVSVGGLSTIGQTAQELDTKGVCRISPTTMPKMLLNSAANWIATKWQLRGPIHTVSNACASGPDAIGIAFHEIASGRRDCMLAGGTESVITPLAIGGFYAMRALSAWKGDPAEASRPFSADRSGFVIAEGAGMLFLEEYEHARARGVAILAELVGYGSAADGYHPTAMHPEGAGSISAIRAALQEAQLAPEAVDYINAHGTATPMNDAMETRVIKEVYKAHAYQLLVSSTKSMTGHMLGATGAVEALLCVKALQEGIVPPTINRVIPDPECDLNYVVDGAVAKSLRVVATHSFGFGGVNAVLIFRTM